MPIVEKAVDKSIAQLSQKLKKAYEQAYIELKNQADAYFKQFKAEDAYMREQVKKGMIKRKDWVDWRQRKMMYNKRYNDLVKRMSEDLTKTDQLAYKMIARKLPEIYTFSANYEAMNIERVTGNPFTVYNEEAVAKAVMSDNLYLPPKLDVPKDTIWNAGRVNGALAQGILQGDGIMDIASRLQAVTNMNDVQAVRTARTSHTAVCNAGRMDTYKRAEDMGIDMGKQWLAIHDERTRDAHAELDKQIVDVDEPFVNSLGAIMYPADPTAHPSNVYNCRCSMRGVIAGHMYQGGSMTEYNAWIKKRGGK